MHFFHSLSLGSSSHWLLKKSTMFILLVMSFPLEFARFSTKRPLTENHVGITIPCKGCQHSY
jgi:hypothetical protein